MVRAYHKVWASSAAGLEGRKRRSAEAAVDGLYVVRTSVPETELDAHGIMRAYRRRSTVERAFRSLKTAVDLKVRPVFHRSAERVRAHVLLFIGKGRRERELPLWKETRSVLDAWLDVRPRVDNDALFLNARGRAMSRDGFAHRLAPARCHGSAGGAVGRDQACDPARRAPQHRNGHPAGHGRYGVNPTMRSSA